MSGRLKQRTVCQSCTARCRVSPLEVMLRGGRGWRGHWNWRASWLCPTCKEARIDQLMPDGGQLVDEEEL